MKILIVEDDAGTRSAIGKLLRRAGATVTTAGDGSEALRHLLESKFDVLLTDLHMPNMDGFELIDHCTRLPLAHRPRRVVAISGEYDRGVLRSLAQGPTVDYFHKPLELNALLDSIGGMPN